jgi:hypothetical protein
VKDAFAYAHKAIAKLTNANMLEQTADPFDPKDKRARVDSVSIRFWHTNDHFGQAVEYARMNDIVPPASQQEWTQAGDAARFLYSILSRREGVSINHRSFKVVPERQRASKKIEDSRHYFSAGTLPVRYNPFDGPH